VSTTTLRFRNQLEGADLRQVCRETSATPFVLHLAAYAIVIARAGGSERVVFGSSVARLDQRLDESMLGYFLDMMLIPVRVRPQETLGGLIRQVQQVVADGQKYALPYKMLAEALNPRFASSRPWPGMNLYDAWVRGRVFESVGEENTVSFGTTKVTLHSHAMGYTDLYFGDGRQADAYSRCYLPALYIDDTQGRSGYLEYNRAVFAEKAVGLISARLGALIGMLAKPDVAINVAWHSLKKLQSQADSGQITGQNSGSA
jgi:hypothetical protein